MVRIIKMVIKGVLLKLGNGLRMGRETLLLLSSYGSAALLGRKHRGTKKPEGDRCSFQLVPARHELQEDCYQR